MKGRGGASKRQTSQAMRGLSQSWAFGRARRRSVSGIARAVDNNRSERLRPGDESTALNVKCFMNSVPRAMKFENPHILTFSWQKTRLGSSWSILDFPLPGPSATTKSGFCPLSVSAPGVILPSITRLARLTRLATSAESVLTMSSRSTKRQSEPYVHPTNRGG